MGSNLSTETGIIIGVVVGICCIVVIVLIYWFVCKQNNNNNIQQNDTNNKPKYDPIKQDQINDDTDIESDYNENQDVVTNTNITTTSNKHKQGEPKKSQSGKASEYEPILSEKEQQQQNDIQNDIDDTNNQHIIINITQIDKEQQEEEHEDEQEEEPEEEEEEQQEQEKDVSINTESSVNQEIYDWFNQNIKLNETLKNEYFNLFINNEYNKLSLIKEINENILIEIGINNKLHRKELLSAIYLLNDKENQDLKQEEFVVMAIGSDAMGNMYQDTKDFDNTKYLSQIYNEEQINLSRIHLSKIIYWKSKNLLNGIQCEWILYNDDGKIVKTFKSKANYGKYNSPTKHECNMSFGDYFYDPITLHTGKYIDDRQYINSLSIMTQFNGHLDKKIFGGIGGAEQNISIPKGNIIIGFHGGYNKCIHNLGVISIPYKSSVAYDLIKCFLKKYRSQLSNKAINCILDYVFYLNDDNSYIARDIDEISWQQPFKDAKGTCKPYLNYDENKAMQDAKV